MSKTKSHNPKFIFITGGVVSSLGKGLASASLAAILQGRGFKVRLRKLDPYLNVSPGAMSPYQHGEVFITDDGTEADLDLGHYERFSAVSATKYDSITTGKIYSRVIENEQKGVYAGATIQVVPHVTNEIKNFILSEITDEDFVLCEIGGTVGDIESQPYLESIRQIAYDLGKERVMFIHVTLLPFIPTAGELKTKPTQHSVKKLQEYGIQPDMLLCRSQTEIPQNEKRKLALFCNVREENVITAPDVSTIYEVPVAYAEEGMDAQVCKYFNIDCNDKSDLRKWIDIVETIKNPKGEVKIAVVGQYTALLEAYKSLNEAITHGGIANSHKVKIKWINSDELNDTNAALYLKDAKAIIVPDGSDNQITAIKYARENKIPFLGIDQGMHLAIIETLRSAGNNACEYVVNSGMRIGAYESVVGKDTLLNKIYKSDKISERHRHQNEVNKHCEKSLNDYGMFITGWSPDGNLPEVVEITNHPWFIGVQFHPELKSKPFAPHPLFVSLIKTAINL